MPRGKAPKLTSELADRIAANIAAGVPFNQACRLVGLKEGVGKQWLYRGRGKAKDRKPTKLYVDFVDSIEAAQARDMARGVAIVSKAAKGGDVISERTVTKTRPVGTDPSTGQPVLETTTATERKVAPPDWRAAAWQLERRYPDDFAPKPANLNVGVTVQLQDEVERATATPLVDPRRRIILDNNGENAGSGVAVSRETSTQGDF